MKYVILIMLFSLGRVALSQNKEVRLLFVEKSSGESIDVIDYTVQNIRTKKFVATEKHTVLLSANDHKIRLRLLDPSFKHLDTLIILNDFLNSKKKQLAITIYISFDGQLVDGVDVSAFYKPQIIFSSDSLHVEDFEVIAHNKLIVLTYPKKLAKGSRLIYVEDSEIIHELDIPMSVAAIELYRDYRGKTYLKGKKGIYHILIDAYGFSLNHIDLEDFNKHIKPVHDTLDSHIFLSNYSEWYPAFEYYGVDVTDSNFQELAKIEDKEMMELYRAEYKWADVRTKLWAWDMESETGIDREIWVGANYFTRSIYYEPLYAPIFLRSDSVIVIDFYQDSLFIYDGNTYKKIASISIDFHHLPKKTGWKKRMLQDPVSAGIFNIYDDAGFFTLREIGLPHLEEKRKLPLHYRYCEKIKLHNGYVYYTYRPFESSQKKYLYREKLAECKVR